MRVSKPALLGPGYDVMIFAGQSNEVGRGVGAFIDNDSSADSRIFQVGRYGDADMKVVPATRPLHFWRNQLPHLHIGHDLSFARYYALNVLEDGRNVLIIPAASSGTSILQWLGLDAGTGEPLYSDMAARIQLALSQPGNNSIVRWVEHQGEQDVAIATDPDNPLRALMPNAGAYLALKLQLIDKVRADFGFFPMQFGLFSDEWLPGDPTKAAFQQAVITASLNRRGCRVVSTKGVPTNRDLVPVQDDVHFNAAGQVEMLAKRHYDAFLSLHS